MNTKAEGSIIPAQHMNSSLVDLGEKELLIVVGGRAKKPKVTIEVKPDGTMVVTQH
jgi:hypothetical protein